MTPDYSYSLYTVLVKGVKSQNEKIKVLDPAVNCVKSHKPP